MVHTGEDVTVISPKSWPKGWTLQEVDIKFQGVGTLSQIKQSTRCIKCTEPERQIRKLRSYVADISINYGEKICHNSGKPKLLSLQFQRLATRLVRLLTKNSD